MDHHGRSESLSWAEALVKISSRPTAWTACPESAPTIMGRRILTELLVAALACDGGVMALSLGVSSPLSN